METTPGALLAQALHRAFQGMVSEVVAELARQGHPGVTATLEFALAAVRAGARDASTLGRSLSVSKQAAAKTIATLESLGYVRREADPADARRKLLVVTDRGEQMTALGAQAFDSVRSRWIAEVGAEQVDRAERALGALGPNLGLDR